MILTSTPISPILHAIYCNLFNTKRGDVETISWQTIPGQESTAVLNSYLQYICAI
jgi:hypothetical protein